MVLRYCFSDFFMNISLRIALLMTFISVLAGCSVRFNMTGGGAVNPDIKSISIQPFAMEAALAPPYTGQFFSTKLQERFLTQSRLSLTDNNPSIELSGSITQYSIAPVAVQGNTSAAQNRLTLSIKVSYKNNVVPNESWDKTFSQFEDFDASRDLASIERDKIEAITTRLTQEVFNESLGKW